MPHGQRLPRHLINEKFTAIDNAFIHILGYLQDIDEIAENRTQSITDFIPVAVQGIDAVQTFIADFAKQN